MLIRRRNICLITAAILIALTSLAMAGTVLLRSFRADGGVHAILFEQIVTQTLALVAVASSLRQLWSGHKEWPLSIFFEGLYALLAITFFYGVADGLTDGLTLPAAECAAALVALVLLPLPQIIIFHERLGAPSLPTVFCVLLTAILPVVGLAAFQVTDGLMMGASVAMAVVFVCQLFLMALRLLQRKLSLDAQTLSLVLCAVGFLAGAFGPLVYGSTTAPTGIGRHMLLAAMLLTVVYITHLWHVQRRQMYSRLSELSRREEEYRLAVEQSGKLIMRYDTLSRCLTQKSDASAFFGLPAVVEGVPDSLIEIGFIDSGSRVAFRRFYEKIFMGEPEGSASFACLNAEGKTVWMHADFTRMPDEGRGQYVISCYELKGMCEKAEAYRKRKAILNALDPQSTFWAEADLTRGTVLGLGGELMTIPAQLSGVEKFNGYLSKTYLCADDREAFLRFLDPQRLKDAYAREIRTETLECRRVRDGQPTWMLATVDLLADPCSMNVRAFLTLEDTEEKKRRETLERQRTAVDELTGLLSRAAFISRVEALEAEAGQALRYAILTIDIDGFKNINDVFGHQFGDRALCEAASEMRAILRKDDFAARFGGDEFVLCLRDLPLEDTFLERRCHALCRLISKQYSDERPMTASIGVAVYPADGNSFDQLYRYAGQGLSCAKQAGGNRFARGGDAIPHSATDSVAQPTQPVTGGAPHHNTVIVVDSRADIRQKIRETLEEEYAVRLAQSTEEARALLKSSAHTIGAMLLEARMEDGGGLELLREMSEDAYYQSIPVIMLNVAEDDEDTHAALELGAVDFIRLPVDTRMARLRVRNAITRRETENLRARNRELMVQRMDEARHQSQLRYMAEHDGLTQLYNKAAFLRHAQGLLRESPSTTYCMVSFDIQRFRVFNSIFGHEEGDRLLRYIAVQLAEVVGSEGVYSRSESDRFAFLTPFDKEELESRMERLNASMRRYNRSFEVLLSFGVCLTDGTSDTSAAEMYDRAEMAKYTIKTSYIKRWAYYDDTMRDRMIGEQEIISRMNAALEDEEFEVYFQPKCRLDTGAMAAAEALVRWNHPTRGLMSPNLFIPIFEKNGFIMKLDLYMWEHVCAFLQKRLRQNSGSRLSISVNISRASLYNPTLCETLDALCKKYQVPNECVEVEITETAYIENAHLLRGMIDEFHRLGFVVEMDDFGSGYSSLNLLKELQVDVLKLDMQLLSSLDGRSGSILRSIVDMAGRLSLPVIAEGVETEEQARFLAGIGCQQAQGYYYARPMPGDRFTQLLSEQPLKTQSVPHTMDDAVRQMDGLLCSAVLCSLENEHIRLLRTNDYYLNMMHIARSVPVDRDLEPWIGTEDCRSLLQAMKKARGDERPQKCAYIQRDQNGRYRLLHADISYLFDEGGRPMYLMTVEDASRRED